MQTFKSTILGGVLLSMERQDMMTVLNWNTVIHTLAIGKLAKNGS